MPMSASKPDSQAIAAYRHTRCLLIAYYLLAVVWGVRQVWHSVSSRIDLLVPLTFQLALAWWAIVDAKSRNRPIPLLSQQWYFWFGPLLVPVYVISSRGWRGVGFLVLHVALWMAVTTAAYHVGGVILYGDAWIRALLE
jgi:hypothetical protein